MEKNIEKIAKMALEADSNVVGESFIIQPEKNLASKLGTLFGVIEIYNINDAFLDGFLGAISDLKTEYYLPPFNLEKGVEKRFEEAISRANRRIFAAFNSSVEEIDLRNVSAAIGLFHGGKVYLSSAGRVKGLFYRRKKNSELLIIDILSGNGEARFRPEPEKLFANILSGDMTSRDGLLLINEEFLGVFSQKELGETLLNNSSAEAIRNIDDSLREKVSKKNFYAVAIAPMIEPEIIAIAKVDSSISSDVSTKPFKDNPVIAAQAGQIRGKIAADALPQPQARKTAPTQQSIDRLLITQVRTEKYLTPSLLPQWQKILLVILAAVKKASAYSFIKLKKISSAGMKKASDWIKSRSAKKDLGVGSETAERKIETPASCAAEAANDGKEIAKRDDSYQEKSINEEEGILSEDSPEPDILIEEIETPKTKPPGKLAGSINIFLNGQIEKFLALKRGQQIILSLGLILLFLFSQSVVMIGRATDKSQTGSSQNSIIAKQIEDLLNGAEAQNIFNDEAGALQSIKKAGELLAQIPETRLNRSFKAGLQDKISRSAKTLQKISFFDDPAVAAGFASSGQTQDLAGMARTDGIFWAFDNQAKELYRLDAATGAVSKTTTSLPSIRQLVAIDNKTLAFLAQNKSYYKYDIAKNAASKFTPPKDYFHIKPPATASPFVDPSIVSSTIDMSITSLAYSFYLDGANGRVVAMDNKGVLKRQFYSDKFKDASAISADAKNKKLWIFSSGKAYLVNLDF